MKYYSTTTKGFYDDDIHGSVMPADVVGISDEQYVTLLHGMNAGFTARINNTGQAELVAQPPPTQEQARARKLAELADYRWQVETGGVSIGGMLVATDRESQAMLTGALSTLQAGYVSSIDWKGVAGWATLTLTELETLAQGVSQHVQWCFAAERQVASQVDALPDDAQVILNFDIAGAWSSLATTP